MDGRVMAEHRHSWGDDDGIVCTSISPEVCLTPIRSTDPGARGFWFGHEAVDHEYRCMGRVPTTGDHAWTETGTLDGGDLTLSPSILCRYPAGEHSHEFHGFVRDGRWVPC